MFRFLLVVAFIIFAILNICEWNPIIFLVSILFLVFALLKYVNNLQKQIQLLTLLLGGYSILSLGLLFTTFDLHSIDWITKYIVIPIIFLVLNSFVVIVSCLFVLICNKYIKYVHKL